MSRPNSPNEKDAPLANAWGIVLAGGEGTRVRGFLKQLCGGSGLKQFSPIIGRRTMLQHTLDRMQRLIPAERILVVVGEHHREEAERQLAHWPPQNIVYQPANRDTAPGVLLPLAHISHRDPYARIVVSPSDHFVRDECAFMEAVRTALQDLKQHPDSMVLLGMTPEQGQETEYGYIQVQKTARADRCTLPVVGFVEKPPLQLARRLIERGALWNTMVFAVAGTTLWHMVRETAPALYNAFALIQAMLNSVHAPRFTEHIYESISNVNFSADVCAPLAKKLRVLPVANVGWSDWGTVSSILRSLLELGQFDAFRLRLQECQVHPSWYAASLAELDAPNLDVASDPMFSPAASESAAYLSPD